MFNNMPYNTKHLNSLRSYLRPSYGLYNNYYTRQSCENVSTSTVAEFVVMKALHVLASINALTIFLNATIPHAEMN